MRCSLESKVINIGGLDYVIFEDGSIKKRRGEGMLKVCPDKDGYLRASLTIKYKTENRMVHRLVYEAFIGPIPPGLTVDHKDGDKLNNHYDNLQLLGAKENAIKGNAKHWVFISPEGKVVEVYNLKEFCRKNGLHDGHMNSVYNSDPKYQAHKGWRKYHG